MSLTRATLIFLVISNLSFAQSAHLKNHILFHASFDGRTTADYAVGDSLLYSAEEYNYKVARAGLHSPVAKLAPGEGLTGDALHFHAQSNTAVYFSGYENLGYSDESWSGSFSFWLRLDPKNALAPGYCDPISLTDSKYNDGAIWVDFTDDSPRSFRLGAIGDIDVWSDDDKDKNVEFAKRVVTVDSPSFSTDRWNHIVITYSQFNTDNAVCSLYLDGVEQGSIAGFYNPFTWVETDARIMLGLGFIGFIDEITVFDKTLSPEEVQSISKLAEGIGVLMH